MTPILKTQRRKKEQNSIVSEVPLAPIYYKCHTMRAPKSKDKKYACPPSPLLSPSLPLLYLE